MHLYKVSVCKCFGLAPTVINKSTRNIHTQLARLILRKASAENKSNALDKLVIVLFSLLNYCISVLVTQMRSIRFNGRTPNDINMQMFSVARSRRLGGMVHYVLVLYVLCYMPLMPSRVVLYHRDEQRTSGR